MPLSVIETAETLGCSAQYVRKLLREGRLEGEKIGDSWIMSQEEVDNFDRKDLRLKKNDVQDQKSKKKVSKTKLNCLSFFSGAMGLDIGLEESGINVLLACEIDNASRHTIISNEPKIGLIGDIRDFSYEEILEYSNVKNMENIDIIVGGPPCQAFSTAGKRMGFQDERGNVFLKYIDLIIHFKPKYAVLENVRGLLSSTVSIEIEDNITNKYHINWNKTKGSTLFYIKKKLESAGYKVSFNLYNAANFGSPQIRERIVIMCTRLERPVPHLEPTHSCENIFDLKKWRTFAEAVEGLDLNVCDHINFSEKRLKYIRMLKAGENWRNLPLDIQPIAMGNSFNLGGGKTGFYRRLAWDKPSPTVVTHPAMPATELAHPTEDRPLSIQEYKRIQEFPDTWKIMGTIIEQYKQIGNAVPVSLGRAIGKTIVNHYHDNVPIHRKEFQYSRYKNTSEKDFEKDFLERAKFIEKKLESQTSIIFS
jgi:DNA (cytosine-5)-methyltransferase 1